MSEEIIVNYFIMWRDSNKKIVRIRTYNTEKLKDVTEEKIKEYIKNYNPDESDPQIPEYVQDETVKEVLMYLEGRDILEKNYKKEIHEQLRSVVSELSGIGNYYD